LPLFLASHIEVSLTPLSNTTPFEFLTGGNWVGPPMPDMQPYPASVSARIELFHNYVFFHQGTCAPYCSDNEARDSVTDSIIIGIGKYRM